MTKSCPSCRSENVRLASFKPAAPHVRAKFWRGDCYDCGFSWGPDAIVAWRAPEREPERWPA